MKDQVDQVFGPDRSFEESNPKLIRKLGVRTNPFEDTNLTKFQGARALRSTDLGFATYISTQVIASREILNFFSGVPNGSNRGAFVAETNPNRRKLLICAKSARTWKADKPKSAGNV